ncbi:hypothetical protein H5410_006230 [Solanum commersonii]|uniref:Uncharacterized protein n=1 Tax=Solanum commersonii TaxID=4109 RepID=A0A9J6A9K4_SOLCO|nr:hypothetical protein H5410_006230 [Solanum commersonii]
MEKCGYNCQLKDLVMSYIPHFFHNRRQIRVVDGNPIEEDHNLEEDQQDMLNDEFDDVDMNNHDAEIGKDDVPDFESHNPPIPIVGSNIPCSSQSSVCVNNFPNGKGPSTRDMSNQLLTELGCKVSYWKIYKGMEHAKSNVRGTHEHGYAVFNACEFNDHFNQIRDLVPKAAETLGRIGFRTWSRAFFAGNRYNIMTSNIMESVNSMFDVEENFSIVSI